MSRSTTTRPTRASSALSVLVLAGCAGYGPGDLKPGATEAAVVERMGAPTARAPRGAGGARLDYARGPFGKHTWRIDLDASGRVASIDQLLTERNFESLQPGDTRAQVVDRLGPPTDVQRGWRGVGQVWFYRYDTPAPYCRRFQVWLVDERVREATYASDPVCEDRDRREPFTKD